MSYELLYFRGSEKILKDKNMGGDVHATMEYLNDAICGTAHRREILRMVMDEEGWRSGDELNIIPGRRYSYKGIKRRVAIDGTFSSYEFIQTALFRLQLGFDMKKLDAGIVLVTAQRGGKSPLGTTKELILKELELLYPTISLPVAIALFDLGKPGEYVEDEMKKAVDDVSDETSMDNIAADLTDPAEDQDVVVIPMPSTRRSYRQRRNKLAVNQ